MQISDIKDSRARNYIRGAIGATRFEDAFSAMESFRSVSSYSDAKAAFGFLRNHPLAGKFAFPDDFPSSSSTIRYQKHFDRGKYYHELAQLGARMDSERSKLARFVEGIGELNVALRNREIDTLNVKFSELVGEYGYSIVLLRKLISVRDLLIEEASLSEVIDRHISSLTKGRRSIVAIAVEDLMDRERDYPNVRASLSQITSDSSLPDTPRLIIRSSLSWFPSNLAEFYHLIQAYGHLSLVDSLWFFCSRIERIEATFGREVALQVGEAVPLECRETWQSCFPKFPDQILAMFAERYDDFSDLEFFRCSNAWIEYKDVSTFQLIREGVIGGRLDNALSPSRSKEAGIVVPRSIEEIVSEPPKSHISIDVVDPANGGFLDKTIGLIDLINRNVDFQISSGEQALRVVSCTTRVSELLTWDEISNLIDPQKDDLSAFLSAALKLANSPSERAAHSFRKATQAILINQFDSDLQQFAAWLDKNSSAVLRFCILEFDELFLSKLFDVMKTRSAAIQARVKLLEFYGYVTDDNVYADRASALNTQAKLAAIRADFDDIRIAVDAQKFELWLDQTLSIDIRPLSKSVNLDDLEIVSGDQIRNPQALYVNQSVKIAALCERAYAEFSRNQFWGIASYVGRRIRHGTLDGMMLGELRAIVESCATEFNDSSPRFVEKLNSWLKLVDASVQRIDNELLRIRSGSKPAGAFLATIVDTRKHNLLNEAISEITKAMVAERSTHEAIVLLRSYCWAFLEVDLAALKETLEQIRTTDFVLPRQTLLGMTNPEEKAKVARVLTNIDEKVLESFRKLAGWLTRPSDIQPTASISELFQAVVEEVSEYAPRFKGKTALQGDTEVELYSGRYHHVYDILNVLVSNAAKHGPNNGAIALHVDNRAGKGGDEVSVRLLSQSHTGSKGEQSVRRLKEAMCASLDQALVQENFSGIRKARHIVENNDELSNFEYTPPAPNFHAFSFTISSPNE